MKAIVEKEIGGDGAKAGLYADADSLIMQVSYPMAKLISPLAGVIDSAIDKVEAAVPGDWDKAILEPIRAAAKAELQKLLSQVTT